MIYQGEYVDHNYVFHLTSLIKQPKIAPSIFIYLFILPCLPPLSIPGAHRKIICMENSTEHVFALTIKSTHVSKFTFAHIWKARKSS